MTNGQLSLFAIEEVQSKKSDSLSEETFDNVIGEIVSGSSYDSKEGAANPDSKENFVAGDKILTFLDKMAKEIDEQNRQLQAMIDELQEGWSEDEKLQISDPKEWQRRQSAQEQNDNNMKKKELSTKAMEVLVACTTGSNIVKLPEIKIERLIYLEVKNKLELIGGKWKGGKVQGFVFQEDPTELLEQIANGDNRNLKKEFQFFATPKELCSKLVELADIGIGDLILEPSAGQGAIVKAILEKQPDQTVWCYEAMSVNKTILEKIECVKILGDDFLTCDTTFDRIIANPPFSKNQDIDHVRHMYECLREDGRLVSITSTHWQHSSNKKETQFREWLKDVNAEIIPVDAGAFKESGTTIATVVLVINK